MSDGQEAAAVSAEAAVAEHDGGPETQQAGGEEKRGQRRNRPRPRGGARERERRERQARREQRETGNAEGGEAGAAAAAPAAEGAAVNGQEGAAAGETGGGRRGRREGGRGRGGGGGAGGRGRAPRLAWRTAVDDAGQPLTREQLWDTATDAAKALPTEQAPAADATAAEANNGGPATDAAAAAGVEGEAEAGDEDGFEAGHILEIARDPKTGDVLGVREIWLAPSARRRPRNPRGSGSKDSAAALGGATGGTEDHEGQQEAAAQRLMQELEI